MNFEGRVAIVTGGSTGIGRSCAQRLCSRGATVVITGRTQETLIEARDEIEAATSNRPVAMVSDISDPEATKKMVDEVARDQGKIDIVVNNAGYNILRPLLDTSLEDWQAIFATNLTGAWVCTNAAVRHMIERGDGGRIVMMSSVSGQHGLAGRGAYAATKGAMDALMRVYAIELARHGITVNGVAPGPTESALTKRVLGSAARDGWGRVLHVNRYGKADEIAAAVEYLASDDAAFVTGHVIPVDGGYRAGANLGDVPGLEQRSLE